MSFIHKTLAVGSLQCNCQLLVSDADQSSAAQAVVIDPGDDVDQIISELKTIEQTIGKPVQVQYLLHTHAHFDHIGATKELKLQHACDAKICLHKDDEFIYSMLQQQGMMFGQSFDAPLPVNHFLQDEEVLQVGQMKIEMIHTPGHSPGGVSFRLHEDSTEKTPEIIFTGDTLFRESIGRSDLWGGDESLLKKSIQEKIYRLDDDTLMWPGHGPESLIGYEKRKNPYVRKAT